MKFKIFEKFIIMVWIVVQLWFFYIMINYPVSGIHLKKMNNDQWIVESLESSNIASNLGIKVGDTIISINGQLPGEYSSVIKWRTIEQAQKILVLRDDNPIEVITDSVSRSSPYDLLSLSGEIISFVLAGVLYKKMFKSRSAKYLSLVFLTIGGTFMSLLASIRGDAIGKHMITTLVMLFPVVFLHFLIVFLKEKGGIQLPKKYLKYLYFVVLVNFIINFTFYINTELVYPIYHFATLFTGYFFIFGLLLNSLILFRVYLKHRNDQTYASTLIKTIWISLFIASSPLAFFSFLPQIVTGEPWFDPFYMGCFILFFPLSFMYLILSRRLYDIDLLFRRIVFTAIISIIPSAIFVGINRVFASNTLPPLKMLIEFILFDFILTVILYSMEYFTTRLGAVMFPRKHQLQLALKKIARNLGSISSFRQLKEIFLMDIVNSLQVFGGAIVFKYQDTIEIISEGEIDEAEVEFLVEKEMWDHPFFTVFEINRHEEFTSYLIMTQKKTNTFLGMEETQWLNLIITYLSVSLENVHLIRKLNVKLQQLAAQLPNEQAAEDFAWFRKLMFELQENERVRIATDLHDTTMQDLFFLKDRLHTLLEKYSFTREDHTQMTSIIDYIDVINSSLRQSCFELHPYLLKEIGLVQTIEKLVRFEKAVCPFTLQFHVTKANIIEERDLETKRHIFRMVQELINNAKKHSQASRITIRLTVVGQTIHFDYEDDGVGFEVRTPVVAEIGSSGVGMEQMKSRILSLNGHYDLESGIGKGFKFWATFPLKEGKTA